MGKWQLAVYHAWEDEYDYQWDGETKKGCCFKCLLVDVLQPSMYCHAEFKKTKKNEKAYQMVVKKFTEEGIFAFEKVGCVDSVKAQYLTAPKREVINLASTTATPVLGSAANATSAAATTAIKAGAVQPCPTGSVADKVELDKNQHFDLTALVLEYLTCRKSLLSVALEYFNSLI